MDSLSPVQQIDLVLKMFKNDRGHMNFDDLYIKTKAEIDGDILSRIVEKLIRDKYIYITFVQGANFEKYAITFEGFLFNGYEKQQEIEEINQSIAKNYELVRQRNDHRLVVGTWFAGIAAVLLLLWQVYSFYHTIPNPCDIVQHTTTK
ncbi:MAG: hypothetical protein JWR54_3418 [Mucilaginibacter sp.]|nr:hypothetical protein [Mucilaginibacter sp.]